MSVINVLLINFCRLQEVNVINRREQINEISKNKPPIIMILSSSLNLVSETPLERQDLRKAKTILNLVTQNADSTEFREAVDWQGMGLLDYPVLVKHPMDLGTVNQKIGSDSYQWVEQVLDDIQLIWDNCKNYNACGSWIYGMADKMEKYYRKLVKNYFTGIPIAAPTRQGTVEKVEAVKNFKQSVRKIEKEEESDGSRNEKREVIQKLKKLSAQKLGEIVQLILSMNPDAIDHKDDKYQICINQIQSWLWQQIKDRLETEESVQRPAKKVKL